MKRGSADCKGPPHSPATPRSLGGSWMERRQPSFGEASGRRGQGTRYSHQRKEGEIQGKAPPWAAPTLAMGTAPGSSKECLLGGLRKASRLGLRIADKEYTYLIRKKEKHRGTHIHANISLSLSPSLIHRDRQEKDIMHIFCLCLCLSLGYCQLPPDHK